VLHISPEAAGQRLDVFLAAHLNVSRSRAQKLAVAVNGAAAKPSHLLKEGDEVALDLPEPPETTSQTDLVATDRPLPTILFEDEHLIVLDKPRGLAVHPGAGERQATLVDVLKAHSRPLSSVGPAERAGIVHRLDKDTSGAMIVCKSDAAHWKLAADFASRRVRKTYLALVCGVPPVRGRIEAPVERHPVQRKKMAVAASGRAAITEYTVVRTWHKFALLEVNLLTGRTHQIRVHLAYVHHPVVGDDVYGGLHRALDSAPHPASRAAIESLSGQALHSAHLAFEHPVTGESLEFAAPLPIEMQRIIESLDNN